MVPKFSNLIKKFKTIKTIDISNIIDPGDIMGVKKSKEVQVSSF